jgi:hypothetical protein
MRHIGFGPKLRFHSRVIRAYGNSHVSKKTYLHTMMHTLDIVLYHQRRTENLDEEIISRILVLKEAHCNKL